MRSASASRGSTPTPAISLPVLTPAPKPVPTPSASGASSLSPTGPTPTPTATVRIVPPVAAAALPEAGTLVVRGDGGTLYRYEGLAGTLERLTGVSAWTPLQETSDGVYEMGLQGGVVYVPWHGPATIVPCGGGNAPSVSPIGACASVGSGPDGGGFARYPGESEPRRILLPDWRPQAVAWDPDSRRLALLRFTTDAFGYQARGHDALWMLEVDGRLRKVYEPCCGSNGIGSMRWSPAGDVIALLLSSGCAGCDGEGGNPLELIDPISGQRTVLGPTPGGTADFSWSPSGAIAFVRGTMNKRSDATLIARWPDGAERELDTGGYAPTWDALGERLAWARSDGTAVVLHLSSGERSSLTCAGGSIVGARFATRGDGVLLLCRRADPILDIFDVFLSSGGRVVPVVTDLGGGFRYLPPDIRQLVAWHEGAP